MKYVPRYDRAQKKNFRRVASRFWAMLSMAILTPDRSHRPTRLFNWSGFLIPIRQRPLNSAKIDLASGRGAVEAATAAEVQHFIYVSVAQPAPMMKAYIQVRSECEAMIRQSGMNATILRPWYVLGPGHRWPYFLIPFYKLMELLPQTRAGATRLGLVTLDQMSKALLHAVENPSRGVQIIEVPEIRVPGRFPKTLPA
jgi:hypothetical protein